MSDRISNFLTSIRNGYLARKPEIRGTASKMHVAIATILQDAGYIRSFEQLEDEKGHPYLKLELKYVDSTPAVTGLKRLSKPGCRVYCGSDEIPRTLGGLGIAILTTSRGVMNDRDARSQKLGGELICSVW
jgi:small subunit ribosomal protein S8